MKKCSKCGVDKDVSEFYKKHAKCKECHKKVVIAYQKKNPEKTVKWHNNSHDRLRPIIDSYRTSCVVCGEDRKTCLDFHHLKDKKFGISNIRAVRPTEEALIAEIEKCVVVCANCHRLIHTGEIKLRC